MNQARLSPCLKPIPAPPRHDPARSFECRRTDATTRLPNSLTEIITSRGIARLHGLPGLRGPAGIRRWRTCPAPATRQRYEARGSDLRIRPCAFRQRLNPKHKGLHQPEWSEDESAVRVRERNTWVHAAKQAVVSEGELVIDHRFANENADRLEQPPSKRLGLPPSGFEQDNGWHVNSVVE